MDELPDIPPRRHDLHMAFQRLRVVGNAGAAGHPGRHDRRGKHPKNALHSLPTLARRPMQRCLDPPLSNRRTDFRQALQGQRVGLSTLAGLAMRPFAFDGRKSTGIGGAANLC